MLIVGNNRFVNGKSQYYHSDSVYIKSLQNGQHPFAAIVSCSDSRVPVEFIFDQGFGDLFVIRSAGNALVDASMKGSVDYAVNHVGVKLIVVLGHTNCGAITSLVTPADSSHSSHSHTEDDGAVPELIEMIGRSMSVDYKGSGCDVTMVVEENVKAQVNALKTQSNVSRGIESGVLDVVGAVYNLSDRTVTFID